MVPAQPRTRSAILLLAVALANAGGVIAYLPLFSLLLPMRVEALEEAAKIDHSALLLVDLGRFSKMREKQRGARRCGAPREGRRSFVAKHEVGGPSKSNVLRILNLWAPAEVCSRRSNRGSFHIMCHFERRKTANLSKWAELQFRNNNEAIKNVHWLEAILLTKRPTAHFVRRPKV